MTNASHIRPAVRPSRETRLGGLRRFNAGLGVLHLIQGIAMLALASTFSLSLTGSCLQMSRPPRSSSPSRTSCSG